jgi:hypothetical protein
MKPLSVYRILPEMLFHSIPRDFFNTWNLLGWLRGNRGTTILVFRPEHTDYINQRFSRVSSSMGMPEKDLEIVYDAFLANLCSLPGIVILS